MSRAARDEVRLATDIARQFADRAPGVAAAAVADHIARFWAPPMRRALLARADAGDPMDPLVAAAVSRLRDG